MLLTEYDEKLHLEHTFREGEESGYRKGINKGIYKAHITLIRKLVKQGYTTKQISELMELDESYISQMIELIQDYPEKSDMELAEILLNIMNKN